MFLQQIFRGLGLVGVVLLAGCAAQPADIGYTQAQWQVLPPEQKRELQIKYKQIKSYNRRPVQVSDAKISVEVLSGTAKFPPTFERLAFYPVSTTLKGGQCRQLVLQSRTGAKKTQLGVCSSGASIELDPSHYQWSKVAGSLLLYRNPTWRRGNLYPNINTTGYAALKNAHIKVTLLSL